MIYLYSFLFAGLMCLIAQIILDNTKLTPGHVTSIYTIIGSFLAYIGLYPKIIKTCGAGATSIIINFGATLYDGAYSGLKESGLIGVFTGMFSKSSAIITATILFGVLMGLLLNPKN